MSIHANIPESVVADATTRLGAKVQEAVQCIFDFIAAQNDAQQKKAAAAQQTAGGAQQQQDDDADVLALFGPTTRANTAAAASSSGAGAASSAGVGGANSSVGATPVSVDITYIRAPAPSRVPWSIRLPHAVHDMLGAVCLVTPAPQERFREQLEDSAGEAKRATGGPPLNIARVMDVDKLQGRFQDPVAARALAKSFDGFIVHNEVHEFPSVLTGEFMTHHFPIWMSGGKKAHLNDRLLATMNTVMLPRRGNDSNCIVVGHTRRSVQELCDNVAAFCAAVTSTQLGGGWRDVLAVRLSFQHGARRIVLPVYAHDFKESHGLGTADAPKPKLVPLPKHSAVRRAREEDADGDKADEQHENDAQQNQQQQDQKSPSQQRSPVISATSPRIAAKSSPSLSSSAKKNNTISNNVDDDDDDDDDDDIPTIDASPAVVAGGGAASARASAAASVSAARSPAAPSSPPAKKSAPVKPKPGKKPAAKRGKK